MRKALAVLIIMLSSISAAPAQVSFGFSTPDVSIGVNLPVYPELVRVPGYPVYYAPQLDANYFFYDGLYWVFDGTNWYASSWYNGPWHLVVADAVPLYLLRVPVRYYREPPRYFRGWAASAPPRWGVHWGDRWERNHRDWDRWDHRAAPAPAPLPTYQRSYTGNRYPSVTQQRTLESRNYHYQPRDRVVQQHVRVAPVQNAQAPRPSREEPRDVGRNARLAAPSAVAAQRLVPRSNAPRAMPPAGEQRTPPALAHRGTPQAEPRTPPALAHRAAPQAAQRTPPALAHRAAPQAAQRAAAERSLQQAGRPPSTPRAASPAMAHRAAPPTMAQHRGPQAPQARAEAPRPQPRPTPQAHAQGPQGKAPARAAGPGNSAHARGNERQDRPG